MRRIVLLGLLFAVCNGSWAQNAAGAVFRDVRFAS